MSVISQTPIGASTAARLVVLAGATFVYVTFEVFPVGLIQSIAHSLDVSVARVGLLVSGYAVVAALATFPSVLLASRISRRSALVISLLLLVVAEILTVLATNFATMAASRFAAALTHGVVWSLVAPAAATLVPRERVGTATAVVFGGASLALILGSPGTTLIGGLIGWRATALVLVVATIAVTIALFWALHTPQTSAATELNNKGRSIEDQVSKAQERAQVTVNWRPVLLLCGVSILLVTAHFVSYTYFAIIVTELTGASSAVVVMLTIFGIAGAVGTYLIGPYIDRSPRRAELVTMTAFATGLGLLAISMFPVQTSVRYIGAAIAIAVWGLAFAATGPVFQSGVMRLSATDTDRASSVYVTGVQIGIAGGSALGAPLLNHSIGLLTLVSSAFASIVLVIVITRCPTSLGTR